MARRTGVGAGQKYLARLGLGHRLLMGRAPPHWIHVESDRKRSRTCRARGPASAGAVQRSAAHKQVLAPHQARVRLAPVPTSDAHSARVRVDLGLDNVGGPDFVPVHLARVRSSARNVRLARPYRLGGRISI